MHVYLDQVGCRLNYSEMDTLAGDLRAAGHAVVARPDQAQVIVFNSCAVTSAAGRKSRQQISQLHALNPAARIVVTGCWATLRPQQSAAMAGVALVVDNAAKEFLPALLEPWSVEFDDPDALLAAQPDGNPFAAWAAQTDGDARLARTRAFVKVQDGCNNRCTFCIVTIARGAARSRPIDAVVAEVQAQAAAGVQEAVLTGVHLGGYGSDLSGTATTTLRELVAAILTDTDIRRLRLSSLEPWELADDFFDLWSRWPARLCPHLHLPLQAGTDKLLRRMARRCTTASFSRLVAEARAAIPDLIVTTDLIVGFPGETEDDFATALDFVEEMRFAHAHIFPFSARSGTAAATFGDQVTKSVKKERSLRMHALIARTGDAERARFLQRTLAVLWEGAGAELADQDGLRWSGLTGNYLRVTAIAPVGVTLHNVMTSVRLDELNGESVWGTIEPAELPAAQIVCPA